MPDFEFPAYFVVRDVEDAKEAVKKAESALTGGIADAIVHGDLGVDISIDTDGEPIELEDD